VCPHVDDAVIDDHFEGVGAAAAEGEDLQQAGLGEAEGNVEDGVAGQLRVGLHAIKFDNEIKITLSFDI
jgi:hypothetical protein